LSLVRYGPMGKHDVVIPVQNGAHSEPSAGMGAFEVAPPPVWLYVPHVIVVRQPICAERVVGIAAQARLRWAPGIVFRCNWNRLELPNDVPCA